MLAHENSCQGPALAWPATHTAAGDKKLLFFHLHIFFHIDSALRQASLGADFVMLDLVAVRRTSQPQNFVDNRSHITEKKLSYVKYSSKRSDFLRFYAYLCHVIDDFACLDLQH